MDESHRDAWAAGFIDGDGCIRLMSMRPHGYRVRALCVQADQVGMECPAALVMLTEWYGGNVRMMKRTRLDLRPHWRWRVVSVDAEAFLRKIEPYSIIKRAQVQLALESRERAMGKGKLDVADEYEAGLRALKRGSTLEDELARIQAHTAAGEQKHGERWAALRADERVAARERYRRSSG